MKVTIIDYQPEYQLYFENLNKAWLEEYFTVEDVDRCVLESPQTTIIDPGGAILFAVDECYEIIGTVALRAVTPGIFELTKMAVEKNKRGMGAGQVLCKAAIDKAKVLKADKLILYSNTLLKNAIAIYRKLGFTEMKLEKGVYGRANIKMQLALS